MVDEAVVDRGDGSEKSHSRTRSRPNLRIAIPDQTKIELQRQTSANGSSGFTTTTFMPLVGVEELSHHRQEKKVCTCPEISHVDQGEGAIVNDAEDDINDIFHLYTNPNSTFTTPSTAGFLHQNFQLFRDLSHLSQLSELQVNTFNNGHQQLEDTSSSSNQGEIHSEGDRFEYSPSHLQSQTKTSQDPRGNSKGDLTSNPANLSTTNLPSQRINLPTSILSKSKMSYNNSPSQMEAHIQLRIQLAIAENNLAHKTKEAEDNQRSLALVARALCQQQYPPINYPNNLNFNPSLNQNSPHPAIAGFQHHEAEGQSSKRAGEGYGGKRIGQLEQEIETLRRENRILKLKIREKDVQETSSDEGSGKMVRFDESNIIEAASQGLSKHEQKSGEQVEGEGEQGQSAKNKFNSLDELTLVSNPNSPTREELKQRMEIDNVGIKSLDDLLGPEDDTPKKAEKAVLQNLAADEGLEATAAGVSEEHKRAMARFMNVPETKVLKTGFDGTGTQGGQYEKNLADEDSDGPQNRGLGYRNFDRPPIRIEIKSQGGYQVFDSLEERGEAIRNQRDLVGRRESVAPLFFAHGVAYIPGQDDSNYIRTVHIGNLPHDIHLRELLTRVRGGDVVSAILLDTKSITGGSMSAMVQFSHELDAEEYARFSEENIIYFGEGAEKKAVEVTLLESSPTYPMRGHRVQSIDDHKPTRCLAVNQLHPRQFSLRRLEVAIACGNFHRADSFLDTHFDETGTLHLEFSNVALATSARAILNSWIEFRGVKADFEDDPCARPVEDLLLPVEPRKPLWPKGGFLEGVEAEKRPVRFDDRDVEKRFDYGGDVLQSEIAHEQRKRLAALSNQKVEIPTFGEGNLKSSSWADEVNEELSSSEQSSPQDDAQLIGHGANTTLTPAIQGKNGEQDKQLRRRPVGLEGSKFAPPRYENRSPASSSTASGSVAEESGQKNEESNENVTKSVDITSNSESSFQLSDAARLMAQERAERIKGHVSGQQVREEFPEAAEAPVDEIEVSELAPQISPATRDTPEETQGNVVIKKVNGNSLVRNPDELDLDSDSDSAFETGDENVNVKNADGPVANNFTPDSPTLPEIVVEEIAAPPVEA
ncbi:hypothetical protein HYFRA_00006935 [Hymenoscyphus fraxineus]|uniref:RRM domain-containing protein n=1 Tax=Hymenoscyphus fraxineus TaxID=746836 RepID=A0A9N9KN81_9HELO|nr:hypothetical protein HYFRA_00006935 [Hymenoscyphus fraxineus]